MSEKADNYPKVAQLKTVEKLRQRLEQLGLDLPMDDEMLTAEAGSPLADTFDIGGFTVGNRWCIHPMEGWDANTDGSPTELTLRRWRRFGLSGAKLIWGGEAAAVQRDGRANPNQTLATADNRAGLAALLAELQAGHRETTGSLDNFFVGLQLTHSGRFCKPNDKKKFEPRIAYHHPLLDEKYGIDPNDQSLVWTDTDLEKLIDNYVARFQAGLRNWLPLCRHQSMPRLSAARIPQRAHPPRQVRRRSRRPQPLAARNHSPGAHRSPWPAGRRAAQRF